MKSIKIKTVFFYFIFCGLSLYGLEFSQHENDSKTLNAIMATGEIRYDDVEKLDRYLSHLPRKKHTAIYFDSPGGNLLGGIRLGRYFKKNGIKTVIQGDSICASACALAFLGGTDRYGNKWMSSTTSSLLGFHAFSKGDRTKYADSDMTQQVVAEILKYGQYVDAPMDIFIRQFSTPSNKMYWFSTQEELQFGIKVWDTTNNRFIDNGNTAKHFSHQSAVDFIRRYFSDLKKVPYHKSWNMLSNSMKRKVSLRQFVNWWDKQVDQVEISNIESISDDRVKVRLYYHMKNGKQVCSLDTFKLVNKNDRWLIDEQQYRNCR